MITERVRTLAINAIDQLDAICMLHELLVIGLQEDAFPDDPKGAERLHLLVSCYLQLVKPHLKQQRKSLKRLEKIRRKQSAPGAAQQSGQDAEEGMDES